MCLYVCIYAHKEYTHIHIAPFSLLSNQLTDNIFNTYRATERTLVRRERERERGKKKAALRVREREREREGVRERERFPHT